MDYKRLIQLLLMSDEAIRAYVFKDKQGNPNIAPHKAPHGQYPAITHELIAGGDRQFADGNPYVHSKVFQLTIFTAKPDYTQIEDKIDELMRSMGFYSIFEYADINPDTNIISFSKHYKIIATHDMYEQSKRVVEEKYKQYKERGK